MRCAVIGGTGYVGVRLVSRLLHGGHEVAALVRSPHKLAATGWADRVDVVPGDLADPSAIAALVAGADVVVYLAHALDQPDFPERDRDAARAVDAAAADAGVRRVVYLGGLRPSGPSSRHLTSRAEVADVFLAGPVPTAALEASIVVGSGSASFEMIRYLAERVPVLPAVPWLAHRTQPIAIADVLHYLVGALDLPPEVNRRFDVGGPDVLSYLELIRRYLRLAGLPQSAAVPLPVPVPPGAPALAGWVVEALTPLSRQLVTPLIESLSQELVCAEEDVLAVVGPPPGGRTTYDAAVRAALGRPRDGDLAGPVPVDDPALAGPTDPEGSGGRCTAGAPPSRARRTPTPCGRSWTGSGETPAGTSRSAPGRCAAGPTSCSGASGATGDDRTDARCGPATSSTAGASRPSSRAPRCSCARSCASPGGCGSSSPSTPTSPVAGRTCVWRCASRPRACPACSTAARSRRAPPRSSAPWPGASPHVRDLLSDS